MYLVVGIGVSSIAVIRKLKELNKDVIVVTKKEEIELATKYIDSVISYENLKYLDFNKIKYVIKSPGIPYHNKYIKFLKSKHLKIINEIELAYILTKKVGKYIGVSGSVGKSSIVSILYEQVKSHTDNVILAGNIGDPLINYLDKINKNTIIILEISSFQLDDFINMKLNISLLTNIYDNHLDFYLTKEAYYLSKFKLTNKQNRNDYFIVNLDDKITNKYLLKHCFKSKLIDYKSGFSVINNSLYYYKNKILNLDSYFLLGEHNLDNLKSVIVILHLLNMNLDVKTLSRFQTLPYHLKETKYMDISIVNDSKSTCINSLKSAIETYKDKNIILLIGGYNKNLNFNFLSKYKLKYLICFGKLSEEIDKMIKVDIKFDNLKAATIFALKVSRKDDVILFSPGCASFDEFSSYLKRGEAFDNYIKEYFNE